MASSRQRKQRGRASVDGAGAAGGLYVMEDTYADSVCICVCVAFAFGFTAARGDRIAGRGI